MCRRPIANIIAFFFFYFFFSFFVNGNKIERERERERDGFNYWKDWEGGAENWKGKCEIDLLAREMDMYLTENKERLKGGKKKRKKKKEGKKSGNGTWQLSSARWRRTRAGAGAGAGEALGEGAHGSDLHLKRGYVVSSFI
jgi:hypothetical protein